MQGALLAFERHDIIGALVHDGRRHVALPPHRIHCHDAPCKLQDTP
jgi:hypothetical protein